VGEKMSLVEAKQKLKEFIKAICAAPYEELLRIIRLFEKFNEGSSYREDLMIAIWNGVRDSIIEVYGREKYGVKPALELYDDFIVAYIMHHSFIVDQGDINKFIEFLDRVIDILKRDREYYEVVEDIWIDMQEMLKEVLGE
jgi:hypothetical protein